MSAFINSLRRLYMAGKRSQDDILNLLNSGKITEEEYQYIVG